MLRPFVIFEQGTLPPATDRGRSRGKGPGRYFFSMFHMIGKLGASTIPDRRSER